MLSQVRVDARPFPLFWPFDQRSPNWILVYVINALVILSDSSQGVIEETPLPKFPELSPQSVNVRS
jgi:hypothetical protein